MAQLPLRVQTKTDKLKEEGKLVGDFNHSLWRKFIVDLQQLWIFRQWKIGCKEGKKQTVSERKTLGDKYTDLWMKKNWK